MTRADLQMSAGRGAVPAARAWVRGQAADHGLSRAVAQVVELLTSELVANAVVHTAGPHVLVRAGMDGEFFVVEVTDGSDDLPVVRSTGPEVPGGQGMRLVDRLADSWGVDPGVDGGKTVWFRIPRTVTL
jgi:anti-sigma regulatory factor (Ser/Thr protein kinase)